MPYSGKIRDCQISCHAGYNACLKCDNVLMMINECYDIKNRFYHCIGIEFLQIVFPYCVFKHFTYFESICIFQGKIRYVIKIKIYAIIHFNIWGFFQSHIGINSSLPFCVVAVFFPVFFFMVLKIILKFASWLEIAASLQLPV